MNVSQENVLGYLSFCIIDLNVLTRNGAAYSYSPIIIEYL
jgi:hypothetical protein